MKKIVITLFGASLLAGALFANDSHMGDHMHEGKMMNHMNSNGMTTKEMSKMHEECQKIMKDKVEAKTSNSTYNTHMRLLKEMYSGDEFSG